MMEIKLTRYNKYRFYIENNVLLIRKQTRFVNKDIIEIECSSISEFQYKEPYSGLNFIKVILAYIFSFSLSLFFLSPIGIEKVNKKHLHIEYMLNAEKTTFILNLELKKEDVLILKENITESRARF